MNTADFIDFHTDAADDEWFRDIMDDVEDRPSSVPQAGAIPCSGNIIFWVGLSSSHIMHVQSILSL